ncbi:hypothetical protein LTR99_006981 [Exophiala xenobiotica]|nr:hypothetical protein LTR92_006798 [Exophiala xenobiotica]KAK5539496.1 hypothetical protein LTR23_006516 [Chaetothyriales sp. CCFEE 6169]KAK5208877.1 hypothetical protein LTR41_005274 [Exophiala xenobiotica]KAK5221197.1 hypothetical protein LTR72_006757 [Exophiala xenobiotica]KAK5269547.1 hypothetical protein LTR96_005243 [Exophiala xenobiotica]
MEYPYTQLYDGGVDRLRSGQACLTCRKRKNKCDGSRPACGFCNKRGLRCTYSNVGKHTAIDRGYVETLETTVRLLEQELRKAGGQSSVDVLTIRPQNDEALVQDFHRQNPQPRARPTRVETAQPIAPDVDRTSLEKDHDLIKIIKYGEVSIHSALADFGVAPSGTSPSDTTTEMPNSDMSFRDADADIREENFPLDDNSFALPPRTLAYRLVDLFFDNVAPILPLVHEPTFRKDLDALYEHDKSGSIAFRSLINVVFAYGCDYLDLELTRTYELSQDFHERATDLILLVCYELASLEVVQALLLVTLHLNSSMQFHRMWINTGLLVRTAQALNLHLDPSEWNISMIEKELRKRLWWSIYSLDRFISLKHCRPPALNIEAGHSVTPAVADDDQILPTHIAKSTDPKRPPSQLHFFNCLMQLIQISETALSSKSANNPWVLPKKKDNNLTKTDPRNVIYTQMAVALDQESKLAVWLEQLPEHLHFDFENTDSKLRRQQRSLQARYLHTRLMIHRMNMLAAAGPGKGKVLTEFNDSFLQSILTASIQQCIDCSCELASLVKEYYVQNSLGPWWLLLQFLFTTLATLFAVRARSHLVQDLDDNKIGNAINQAMSLLQSFGDINPTLTQCRRYFESMMPWAMDRSGNLGSQNLRVSRPPVEIPFQQPPFAHPRMVTQAMQQRPSSSMPNSTEFQPRDVSLFNMDQAMTDYSAELFSDSTFGTFNFGALDPIFQL